jgi:hypothetical protein
MAGTYRGEDVEAREFPPALATWRCTGLLAESDQPGTSGRVDRVEQDEPTD